jgi:hypothetical protein
MHVDRLTRSTLFDLFCGDRKNRKYFCSDLHNHLGHCGSGLHFCVCLQALEESLDTHEDVNEYILARIHIFSRLTNVRVIIARTERIGEIKNDLTKRRTPIPEKIAFAGENA